MKVDTHELARFIGTARRIVGRDATEMFSLADVYRVSDELGLDGVIYLEQFLDRKHVTVLLCMGRDSVLLYDPLSGVKSKPYDEIQCGLYCQPVGGFRTEYRACERRQAFGEPRDIWARYRMRGRLVCDFLVQHKKFSEMYARGILVRPGLPALQDGRTSTDCATISLFAMSLCKSVGQSV